MVTGNFLPGRKKNGWLACGFRRSLVGGKGCMAASWTPSANKMAPWESKSSGGSASRVNLMAVAVS